ncbi:MAG: hypothetical protein SPF98_03205 [Campylobacter sp.]|nr:hypothetical protein [Campylobacter sp.]
MQKEFLEVLNKPFCALACLLLSFWLTPPFFFMVERMLFLKYRQLNDDEQKEHFCRWFGKYAV